MTRPSGAVDPATPAPDAAAFLATIERMAAENARLTAALAVAEERLRQLEAGSPRQDAAVAANQAPGRAETPGPAARALTAWWDRLMRLLGGG
jgi:hypothetical protein